MSCLTTEFLWIFSYKLQGIIELHGHAMAFHETVSVLQGTAWHSMELYNIPWNSMDLQGNSMEFHGIPWNSITTSWNSVELHGIPWNSMDTPWNSMAFHGTPWILHGYSMEVPWNSMDFHGFTWISMDFHRFPWISMDHGIPWRYFTRAWCEVHQATLTVLYWCQ